MSWQPLSMAQPSGPVHVWAAPSSTAHYTQHPAAMQNGYVPQHALRQSRPAPKPAKVEALADDASDQDEDEEMQRALTASKQEYETAQREHDMFKRILEQSAQEAALAEETSRLEIESATQQSRFAEEERLAREREHEAEIDRVIQESTHVAKQAQAADHRAAEDEQQMLELALDLSRRIAMRDSADRTGWGTASEGGIGCVPVAGPSNEPADEVPLRVLGPTGLNLVWKDGRSSSPGSTIQETPLTRLALDNRIRPLPVPPGVHEALSEGSNLPPGAAPPTYQPIALARPPDRASMPPRLLPRLPDSAPVSPAIDAGALLSAVHGDTLLYDTVDDRLPTLSSLARSPASAAGDSLLNRDGHEHISEGDPFSDENADVDEPASESAVEERVAIDRLPNAYPRLTTRASHPRLYTSSEASPVDRPPHMRSQSASPISPASPVAPHRQPPRPVYESRPIADAPIEYATPPRRSSQPPVSSTVLATSVLRDTYSPESPRTDITHDDGTPSAAGLHQQPPTADVEDVSRWGFLGRRLIKGEGLPDVIQLSNADGDGKYSIFVIETPTWRTLLRLLMWYGSTRLEVSPCDFVDRKSDAAFQCSIVLDFFATAVCLSLRVMPSPRARSRLFSASRRTVVLPLSPIALPSSLAALATLLHTTLREARGSHSGPLYNLGGEVDALARSAGEPLAAANEAERGMIERLKARVLRQERRRPSLSSEEPIEDAAMMIQPFRLDEYA